MYFIGDTHSIKPIFTIIDQHQLENQNIIHVGDFGLGFQPIVRDIRNLEMLDQMLGETGNELYVIRGNHDNPIFWDKKNIWLPTFHNLHLVEDYSVIDIEGKRVLFVGGAISIDRSIRKDENPPSWWENEVFQLNYSKLKEVVDNKKVDIVVTHTAPEFAYPQSAVGSTIVQHYSEIEAMHGNNLLKELGSERADVGDIYRHLTSINKRPDYWVYGHFHSSRKQTISGTEFKLLNINELYKIK